MFALLPTRWDPFAYLSTMETPGGALVEGVSPRPWASAVRNVQWTWHLVVTLGWATALGLSQVLETQGVAHDIALGAHLLGLVVAFGAVLLVDCPFQHAHEQASYEATAADRRPNPDPPNGPEGPALPATEAVVVAEKPARYRPARGSRLVFALVLAVIVFGERLDAMTLTGAAIIVVSGSYTMWREARRRAPRLVRAPGRP